MTKIKDVEIKSKRETKNNVIEKNKKLKKKLSAKNKVNIKQLKNLNEDKQETNQKSVSEIKETEDGFKTEMKLKFTEAEQKERNDRTIFIGNLPSNTKKQQLAKLLSQYGMMLSCRFRKPNGKKLLNKAKSDKNPNIIAYAVMESVEDVSKCLILNGTDFKNHHIRVTKLEKNYVNDDTAPKRTIFVGNLKFSATDEKLHNIFSTCGNIEYVRTINNEHGCNGCAYVCFEKREAVGLAMELDKTLLDDRPIRIEKYTSNKKPNNSKNKSGKNPTGFERRIIKKISKQYGQKLEHPQQFFKKGDPKLSNKRGLKKETREKPTKKSEYRGKKADTKKQNKKFKKRNSLKELAKKIAPRD